MIKLGKEICEYCRKCINYGQAISECNSCNLVIHTKCFKKSNFNMINNKIYCFKCSEGVKILYNPFEKLYSLNDENVGDKFYEENYSDIIGDIHAISNILNNCKSISTIEELNKLIKINKIKSNFSTLFINIDGNCSNFDTFATEIHQLEHKFSIIGLAETKTDPTNKNLYPLDEYNSFYQDPYPGKRKGSGVALYVHKSMNASVDRTLSHTSQNLETLFIKININSQIQTVGVAYRPPNGNFENFLSEFQCILHNCPTKNLYLMGDFNVDLHKIDNENSKAYEELILTSGMFPLISASTHTTKL